MKRKLIIFDIDGTLYDNVNKKMWPSTIECLKKLKENNHELVIASGRNYMMINNINEVKHLINHFILINGQEIISNGEEVYKDIYSNEQIEKLIKDFNDNNIAFSFVGKDVFRMGNTKGDAVEAYNAFRLNKPTLDIDFYKFNDVYQIWCFGSDEQIRTFAKKEPEFDFLSWGTFGFDVLKKGNCKAKTMPILINKLGFDMDDVIAIGDGDNDVEMIKQCGFGISMGNGSKKLKEVANYITDDVDKDGLKKAFEYLKLI